MTTFLISWQLHPFCIISHCEDSLPYNLQHNSTGPGIQHSLVIFVISRACIDHLHNRLINRSARMVLIIDHLGNRWIKSCISQLIIVIPLLTRKKHVHCASPHRWSVMCAIQGPAVVIYHIRNPLKQDAQHLR